MVNVRKGRIYCPDCGTKLVDKNCPCHDYCPKCKKLVNV